MSKSETFVFDNLPSDLAMLKAMPEASMLSPFQTAALTVAVLCNYGDNPKETIDMLNYLKGPQPLSNYEIQFLRDRLVGKTYKPFSFFSGANAENSYVPTKPYEIAVFDNPYSYQNEGYVTLFVRSAGADSPRQIKLRVKPSSGEWFLWEQHLLADIRGPKAADPWA